MGEPALPQQSARSFAFSGIVPDGASSARGVNSNAGAGPDEMSAHVKEGRAGFHEFRVSVGSIAVQWNSSGRIVKLDWNLQLLPRESTDQPPAAVVELVEKLRAYFRDGAPLGTPVWEALDSTVWTPFQTNVYEAIAKIPHGETRTYGWVASRVGNLAATRAVGQALRNNPLPILIPCHRVVAMDSIGGFMGSQDPSRPELDLKRKLLQLETEYLNPVFPFLSEAGT